MRIVWSFSIEGDNIFRYRNMDIKLGGREMATVVYSNEEDDMYNMTILHNRMMAYVENCIYGGKWHEYKKREK